MVRAVALVRGNCVRSTQVVLPTRNSLVMGCTGVHPSDVSMQCCPLKKSRDLCPLQATLVINPPREVSLSHPVKLSRLLQASQVTCIRLQMTSPGPHLQREGTSHALTREQLCSGRTQQHSVHAYLNMTKSCASTVHVELHCDFLWAMPGTSCVYRSLHTNMK